MHAVSYITAELSLLCQEYKKRLDENNSVKAEKVAEKILRELERISDYLPRVNMDGVFFAGELNAHGKEYETEYPHVAEWRKRRESRRKQKREDDEDAEGGETPHKGHGNTKLPYGLCEKHGIEVQKGWTPREAWEALEGKGVSAKEEYRKLKERGKAAKGEKAPAETAAPVAHDYEGASKAYHEKKSAFDGKLKDIRDRMLSVAAYLQSLKIKDELDSVKRSLEESKEIEAEIAGRSLEELEAELEQAKQDYDKLSAINDKWYERPPRNSPEREEWDEWVESLGGKEAIRKMLDDGFQKGGAFSRKTEVANTLEKLKKYGQDGGFAEFSEKAKKLEKQYAELKAKEDACEEKRGDLKNEENQVCDELKEAHKAYSEAVKAKFPTFEDCKTVQDVAERLSAEEFFDGRDLDADLGKNITRETAIITAKDLCAFMDKVPFLKGHCKHLVVRSTVGEWFGGQDYSNVGGYSDNKQVVLNERYYRDYEKSKADWDKYNEETGFHPQGTTFNTIVHHEYSHQLDDYMTKQMGPEAKQFSDTIFKHVCEELNMSEAECKAAVSGYAVNNHSEGAVEWFAEAMSEYTYCENPRPVAQAVGRMVNEYAKRLGLMHTDAVDEYRIRRKKRMDAKAEEEGRWVTTENDHRVHLNEEGVPDKGNPYVLATMRGEGPNPKSREELARHRLQKTARQNRALYSALSDAEKDRHQAEMAWAEAKTELRRLRLRNRVTENRIEEIKQLGYGPDDKDRMRRDLEALDAEMDNILQNRKEWDLGEEEQKEYKEVSGKRNLLKFYYDDFDECFGPDAVTAAHVKEAEERLSAAEKRQAQAEKAVEKARNSIKSASGGPDQERFLTDSERKTAIDTIRDADIWGEMSEAGKAKALESLQHVSDAHLLLLQKTLGNAKIYDSNGSVSTGGSTSWYRPGTGAITMSLEDMDSTRTLWHEYGHFLDDADKSGCNMGTKDVAGYTYATALSKSLELADALHNEAVAKDLQKFFDEVAPGELEFGSWGNGMLKITRKGGGYVEDRYDPAFSTITDKICDALHEFEFHDEEFEEYCKAIGFPQRGSDPKYSDYVEIYYTPKRGLMREREKFKGAKDKFYRILRERAEQRDKATEEHPEYYEKAAEYERRCKKRAEMIGPVSDILCGIFRGNGPWILGGHSADYYSRSDAPHKEAVANYHQMRMMGWTEGLNLLKKIVPSVHDELERTYNEWLWRNVEL